MPKKHTKPNQPNARRPRHSLLVVAALVAAGASGWLAAPDVRVAAQTSEIRAVLEDPTVALTVTDVEYYMVGTQRYARITSQVRFADQVELHFDGVLLGSQSVTYASTWATIIFAVPLSDDEAHEVVLRAFDGAEATITDTILTLRYTPDPPDTGEEEPGTTTPTPKPPSAGFWVGPPNTGVWVPVSRPWAVLISLAILTLVSFWLVVAHRRRQATRQRRLPPRRRRGR